MIRRRQRNGHGSCSMVREKQTVSAQAMRTELRRILDSARFDASDRNRKFLTHVVEEALAGRADRIKACSIATSVFGRDEGFDSIVRIEAGRPRRALEGYCLTNGRDSRLKIDIPRYVPAFGPVDLVPGRPPAEGFRGGAPSVLVAAFEEEGGQSSLPSFTRGFTRSLVVALTRFSGLRVFGAETALRRSSEADRERMWQDRSVDYLVTGQTSLRPGRFEVDVLLVDVRTGRAVWAETFERAVATGPEYAEAHACLSLVYVNAFRIRPDCAANVVADLESRSVTPELIGPIVASLAKAGLPVHDTPVEEPSSHARE